MCSETIVLKIRFHSTTMDLKMVTAVLGTMKVLGGLITIENFPGESGIKESGGCADTVTSGTGAAITTTTISTGSVETEPYP